MKKEVTAVVVARKGSVRVKNKALQLLGSETLLARKIRQLRQASEIDRVVVGTDCEDIKHEALQHGAEVVNRDEYYCDEKRACANEMISNMVSLIDTDVVVWAHCTNPFISADTYNGAVKSYYKALQEGYDSLLSVIELKEHLWSPEKEVLNYNPYAERHSLAKDLPSYYMQDGGVFIQSHQAMRNNSYFFGAKPTLFLIKEDEQCDINTVRDLEYARFLLSRNK